MSDFLTTTYYGNTISQWATAFAIFLASVLIAKILYWFSGTIIKKLTEKTKTRLDDILVDMIEEPIVFAIGIFGFYLAMNSLNLSQTIEVWNGKLYHVLIAFNIAWLIARVIDSMFQEYIIPFTEETENELDDMIVPIARNGIKYTIWIIGIIVGLNNAGYDVGAVLAGLGIGGLALAMAAKDTISNMFGGFTIFTDQPFTIGDKILIKGHEGSVKEIGLRSTRLTTKQGRMLTIPNSYFAENPVENATREPSRKISMTLGLTYDTGSEKMQLAMDLVKKIAGEHENTEELVLTSFIGFGESSLDILLIYFIQKEGDILATQTDINMSILKEFEKNQIEFAFPTRTIMNG